VPTVCCCTRCITFARPPSPLLPPSPTALPLVQDSAKPLILGASDDQMHKAVTPKGFALRSALAVTTTYAAATVAYPLDIVRKVSGLTSARSRHTGQRASNARISCKNVK
jgi:hypothetical protein